MKNKKSFSPIKYHQIVQLILKKNSATEAVRSTVLAEIEALGFVASDYDLPEDYTVEQFKTNAKKIQQNLHTERWQRWFVVVILAALPWLFAAPFESFVDAVFVNPLLSKFNEGIIANIVLCLIVFGLLCWLVYSKCVIRRNIDEKVVNLLVVIGFYTFMYRFQLGEASHWHFSSVYGLEEVKYLDIVWVSPILLTIYKLIPMKYDPPVRDLQFALQDDLHISDVEEDKLSRKELAEYLAKHIVNTESKGSMAIGISAKWGDGKTSFQKLVAQYLHEFDHTMITVEFNPWKNQDTQSIVQDFFSEYAAALRKYDVQLSGRIIAYSKTLTNDNAWWSGLLNVFQYIGSTDDQFNAINQSLERIKRSIVVFIDDLDRLNKVEVMELVKLIRNSANFRNTYFIVGFDRDYLQEVLGKHTEYGKQSFLEKIFQIQLDLSHIPAELIRDTLQSSLLKSLPDYKQFIDAVFEINAEPRTNIVAALEGKIDTYVFIPKILTNVRDIKRFANYFSLNTRLIGSEVVFQEYLYVSLLRFKFPSLIKRIKKNRATCFTEEISAITLNKIAETEIRKCCRDEKIDEVDENTILLILMFLFNQRSNEVERRSVIFADKFDVYFDDSLSTQRLLFREFVPLLNKRWFVIEHQVKRWLDEGKKEYLAEILDTIDSYYDTNRFEKVCRIWVLLLNHDPSIDGYIEAWLKFLGNKDRLLRLYNAGGPVDVVMRLFDTGNDVFFYSTRVLSEVLVKYGLAQDFYFPLTKEECLQVAVKRLKEFIKSKGEFDRRALFYFYYNCIDLVGTGGTVTMLPEANEIMRKYIEQYPTQYLRTSIRHESSMNTYTFDRLIPQYFGSWEAFEEFIKKQMTVPAQKEEFEPMLKYFQKFKEGKFRRFMAEAIPVWIAEDPKLSEHTYEKLFQEYEKIPRRY